ncbi:MULTISPECIES: porin family protein [unclassified Shewanella]|uniref:porin family protein n=1 Tax=unclassified Shewanella TaxID=196818 RepID=UPI001BB94211|nr:MULTISPECIES: porin family protein [unclassified Shewanella]GIU18502.1 membrane protein [Shewanella sp. MBTL60-112-B1]GIU37204.1 membrane protein [Shewanella sp. MBTL60-112-B2]
MKLRLALVFLLVAMSQSVQAEHVVGGSIGIGLQDFESFDGENLGASDGINTELFYRYMLSEHFGVEVAGYAGAAGMLNTLGGLLFDVQDMRYTGIRGAIYSQVYVSQANKLFAKVGTSQSHLKYKVTNIWNQEPSREVSSRGSDMFVAVGWGMDFKSGIGVTAEYQYLPIQEMTVQNVSLGINYRF